MNNQNNKPVATFTQLLEYGKQRAIDRAEYDKAEDNTVTITLTKEQARELYYCVVLGMEAKDNKIEKIKKDNNLTNYSKVTNENIKSTLYMLGQHRKYITDIWESIKDKCFI